MNERDEVDRVLFKCDCISFLPKSIITVDTLDTKVFIDIPRQCKNIPSEDRF